MIELSWGLHINYWILISKLISIRIIRNHRNAIFWVWSFTQVVTYFLNCWWQNFNDGPVSYFLDFFQLRLFLLFVRIIVVATFWSFILLSSRLSRMSFLKILLTLAAEICIFVLIIYEISMLLVELHIYFHAFHKLAHDSLFSLQCDIRINSNFHSTWLGTYFDNSS